jgi:hypothetical protein
MPTAVIGPESFRPSSVRSTFLIVDLGAVVEAVVVDQLAERPLALRELVGDAADVGDRGRMSSAAFWS